MINKKNFFLIDICSIFFITIYLYLIEKFKIINIIPEFFMLIYPIIYLLILNVRKKNYGWFVGFQLFYFWGFFIFIFSDFKIEILICTFLFFMFLIFFPTKYKKLKAGLSILGHIFFIGTFFQGILVSIDNIFYNSIFIIVFIIIIFIFIKTNIKEEKGNELLKFNEAFYFYYLQGLIYVIIADYIHVTIFQLSY